MLTSCMLKWDPAAHDCMYMVLMAIEMANGSDGDNHGQHEEDQRDRCNDVDSDRRLQYYLYTCICVRAHITDGFVFNRVPPQKA